MSKLDSPVYKIVTEQIVELMEKNEVPWSKPWVTNKICGQRNGTSRKPYSGLNALVLALQDFENPYWFTYNQIKAMGATVEKGSKSCCVVGWFKGSKKNKETGEKEDSNYLSCRYYRVFNAEQIALSEDSKIPKYVFEKKKVVAGPVMPLFDDAENLIALTGCNISYSGNAAYYVPLRDKVVVPEIKTFRSVSEYYSTIFHEITHWTGHDKRLKRFKAVESARFASQEYSKEELTAELGSVFVCSMLNISSDTSLRNSAAYLKGWLKFIKNDPKAFVYACQRAQKAADYIVNSKAESLAI